MPTATHPRGRQQPMRSPAEFIPDFAPSPFLKTSPRLQIACLLLVISVVPWRQNVYYSGGADIVVVAKAVVLALSAAVAITTRRPARLPIPVLPLAILIAYIFVSLIGATVLGSNFASAVLGFRLLIAGTVVAILLWSHRTEHVVSAITLSMLLIGSVAAITGISTLASGRLSGGIPPVAPNEIAILCSVPFIVLVWRSISIGAGWPELVSLPILAATIYATGSRTGVMAVAVVVVMTLLRSRRIPIPIIMTILLGIPTLVLIAVSTSALTNFAERGGTENIQSLSSRTIAWSAAFDSDNGLLGKLFGAGLAQKMIPVPGQYWSTQKLDSTWVSAYIQAGWLGLALLTLLVVLGILAALGAPRPESNLWMALLVFVVARSLLESGMLDASSGFLIFFTVVLGASSRRLDRLKTEPIGSPEVSIQTMRWMA
ncbi:UNVERIFIED_CONTAM: hypothetical protein DES50_101253 [Williamsia faeni]